MAMALSARYFARLKLNPVDLDTGPTLGKLRAIQEAHLSQIPFENLSQHAVGFPARLDVEATAHKILDCSRGGFCFELNGLLASFLEEQGYEVRLVRAIVHQPDVGFSRAPSHLLLLVRIPDYEDVYFVDVGFGEPPLHPLFYVLNKEQITPEGMLSKIEREGDKGVLYWKIDDIWKPRLQWDFQDLPFDSRGPVLADFADSLAMAHDSLSLFHQKLIVTRLMRTEKVTLAGNRLKFTSPRFPEPHKEVSELESANDVRKALKEHFFMPLETTVGLDLTKSLAAAEDGWVTM